MSLRNVFFILTIMLVLFGFALPCFADTITYQYDELNRLIRVEYSNGTVIEYNYDAAGNRITKVIQAGELSSFSPSAPNSAWVPQGATVDSGTHSHSD